MANYSARFFKNFSTLAVPLREPTQSNVECWAEREQEPFTCMKIKNSLLHNVTLAYNVVGAETKVIAVCLGKLQLNRSLKGASSDDRIARETMAEEFS